MMDFKALAKPKITNCKIIHMDFYFSMHLFNVFQILRCCNITGLNTKGSLNKWKVIPPGLKRA